MTSNYAGFCTNCGTQYAAGTSIRRNAAGKWVHTSCPQYSDRVEINQQHGSLRADSVALRPAPFNQATQRDTDDDSYDAWIALQTQNERDEARGRQILNAPNLDRDVPAPRPVLGSGAVEPGVYVLADNTIVKVQESKQNPGRTYAKRWQEISGQRLTEADTRVRGEYVFEPGLIQRVAAEGRGMNLDEAKAFILRYGQCARCSRHLKDASSVERGLGPVCVKYFSGASGAEVLVAPAASEAPASTVELADDSEEVEYVERPARREYRSRWTRPSDDDLGHAAGYGADY